jgi:hypothetical protein
MRQFQVELRHEEEVRVLGGNTNLHSGASENKDTPEREMI